MAATQTWDPDRYARNARFVAELGMPVVELLEPRPGERVLDLGCGDGALTRKLVELGCEVVGVDASAAQVEAARKLGLDARVMDGHALRFDAEFDAVFSNAALHWMKRPAEVIAGVRRALRPGGRFVGEFGGAGNVPSLHAALRRKVADQGIDPDRVDPWYFPTPVEYGALLEAAGFGVRYIELIPRPTPIPGDVTDWIDTFGESFLSALPPGRRPAAREELREELRPALCADGKWTVDYVRLRFAANLRA